MTNAVEISNVIFQWPTGKTPVLDIPEFSVGTGERLFVSGSSGSGKTTLLNLLGGVAVPDSGAVSVLGTRLDKLSSAQRDSFRADHVGVIFQLFNLGSLSVSGGECSSSLPVFGPPCRAGNSH